LGLKGFVVVAAAASATFQKSCIDLLVFMWASFFFSKLVFMWASFFFSNTLQHTDITIFLIDCLVVGKPGFSKKQADLFFPPDFQDDFPVAMQVSILGGKCALCRGNICIFKNIT
jgi:hypothetical protein